MKISRIWAMPNKWTFTIKPIADLLKRYDVGKGWIDPFCGMHSPAEHRNDLDPTNTHAQHHMDALAFAAIFFPSPSLPLNGGLFDAPYSLRQVSEVYKSIGIKEWQKIGNNRDGGFSAVRDLMVHLPIVISFGWNTSCMGKKRGFDIEEILIVPHGGRHNDTLVTVERKIK